MNDIVAWLKSVKKLDELIDAKLVERNQLMDLATKITASSDGMPHASGVSDKVGNSAVKLVDLARETDMLIDKLVDRKREVIKALQVLDGVEHLVLHKYYIQGMTLDAIAEDMSYHRVTVSKIKAKAIEHLEHATQCC